jgi:predicted nuclease of predicted toxin-antitoxin system
MIAQRLKDIGYDALSVYEQMCGADDITILKKAFAEKRVLVTTDKDFGEMVFKQREKHYGIILLRLSDNRLSKKIKIIQKILEHHSYEIEENFMVATEKAIRITIPNLS